MNEEIPPRRLELWSLFLRVHARIVDELAAGMEAEQGLPLPWFDVMLQLSFSPGERLRMHEVLRNLVLTRSGLTRRIDRMVAAGMVAREDCAQDGRGVVVALTPLGKVRLHEAIPHHLARVQDRFTRHFSDEEVNTMRGALSRVLDGDTTVGTREG